jgi:hypothetical protein
MKFFIFLAGCSILCGCSSLSALTPAQDASLICALSADGVVLATYSNKVSAATLAQIGAVQQIACAAATQVGAVYTK